MKTVLNIAKSAEKPSKISPMESAKIAQKIRLLFDIAELKNCCESDNLFVKPQGEKGEQFSFIDNGSNILAVAHTDTVQKGKHFAIAELEEETLIFNPKLDDRLGIYTILNLLPKLGITTDILLTENEEIGMSTASNFTTKKEYNWIVEFDRKGTDAVVYHFTDWENEVAEFFDIGVGSFSDISSLDLGCCGVNIGIGYYNEHSKRAYFILEEYIEQIAKFIMFYNKHKDIKYPHQDFEDPTEKYKYYGIGDFYCPVCRTEFFPDETVGPILGQYHCPICYGNLEEYEEEEYEEKE